MGGKKLCTKNGTTRFSRSKISFFPTMVTLVRGQGGYPRASFEQGGGGGEGVLDPKLGVPKMA